MISALRSFIYNPRVNGFLRGVTRAFRFIVPDRFLISPSGLIRLDVTRDLSIKLKTNQTSYITRLLYWNDPKDFEYTSLFVDLIKEVGTFWDIGANIGYYGILGCEANPELQVESFEPSMGPLAYLRENIAINGIADRNTAHAIALSDRSQEIDFYQIVNPKFPDILNLSGEHNTGSKKEMHSQRVTVAAKTIDEVRKGTPAIDLIKIDVEGAEIQVLKGGIDTIAKDRPIIICEVLYQSHEEDLDALMRGLGYRFFAHTPKGLLPMDSLIREEDDGIRNVFFVPPHKESLIDKFRARG